MKDRPEFRRLKKKWKTAPTSILRPDYEALRDMNYSQRAIGRALGMDEGTPGKRFGTDKARKARQKQQNAKPVPVSPALPEDRQAEKEPALNERTPTTEVPPSPALGDLDVTDEDAQWLPPSLRPLESPEKKLDDVITALRRELTDAPISWHQVFEVARHLLNDRQWPSGPVSMPMVEYGCEPALGEFLLSKLLEVNRNPSAIRDALYRAGVVRTEERFMWL